MIDRICVFCKKPFKTYPSIIKLFNGTGGRYCSRKCRDKSNPHKEYKGKLQLKCIACGNEFKVFQSGKNRKCCSNNCRFKYQSVIMKNRPSGMKGKKHSIDTIIKLKKQRNTDEFKKRMKSLERRKKISLATSGEKNHNWKGGITPLNRKIRKSLPYRLWREAVFKRDNFTCQECKARSIKGKIVYLEAHHIKPFYKYPELCFDINNGMTLCEDCHNATKGGNFIGFELSEEYCKIAEARLKAYSEQKRLTQ